MDRRIVCAALNNEGAIIIGARHFDKFMRLQIAAWCPPYEERSKNRAKWSSAEQGFIDNQGNFLTREEAHIVAKAADQIIRRCGGDEKRLFSENLY